MSKLNHLIETKEKYQIEEAGGCFTISVIESKEGIHYDIKTYGILSSQSLAKCADLLKELIQIDCYNSVVRKDEAPGKIKVAKKVTARLDELLEQRNKVILNKGVKNG